MVTDVETLVVTLSANIKTYENAMSRAAGIMNQQARKIERSGVQLQKKFDGIGRGIARNLTTPLAGIGAALGVQQIAAYADAWTLAGNKIRSAAASTGVQVRSLDELKNGANAARTDLESYVDLYAKLIRNASGVAKSEQEIATATDVVSKAFKASGAATSEQVNGILQLGQALGSGVLQGDELRSIRENAPVIAKAIATEMGVSIAQLKDLGAQGKITSDVVFRALINAQAEVERQFNATNATIKDGLTAVNNEFIAYIGNADASAGASRGLVDALLSLSTNFGTVADSVVALSTVIIGALTGRALAGMVVTLGQAVVALGALITALRTGAAVGVAFTASLGPIGLLLGAAAAALLVLSYNQETADKAAQQHKKSIDELKIAFGAVKGGSDEAKAAFGRLATAHIESAEAAVENAKAQLQAAKAIQDAGASAPMFGEGVLAAGQQGYNDDAVDLALKKLDARKSELDDLKKRISSPETGLAADNTGYGTGTGVPPAPGNTKSVKRTAASRFDQDIQAVKDRTAALAAEQQMIGQSVAAQESRRAQIDLETAALADLREEARRNNVEGWQSVELSKTQKDAIKEVADAYGQQSESLQRAQQAFGDINDLGRDALGGFISDIRQGVSATEALSNALDRVIDKLLDSALNSVFGGGTGGGIFGALFGGGFADGGYTGPGGKNQPAGVVHKGEYVFSKASVQKIGAGNLDALHRSTRGFASGGFVGQAPTLPRIGGKGGGSNVVNLTTSVDARGSQMSEKQFRQILDENNKQQSKAILGQVSNRITDDRLRSGAQRAYG